MATAKVNLDALIRRADLYDDPPQSVPTSRTVTLGIRDIEEGAFLFESLRKPDFQRETSDWDPQKVCDLIRSFAEGDLIPAIICWRHGDLNFVVDGAHRLGALIAWIQDDYGDGKTSRDFFGDMISEEQRRVAERTRKLVDRYIGSYREVKHAAANTQTARAEYVKIARNLSAYAIPIQWVDGDAAKVEESFKRINQKAAPIDKTELILIENRAKPNAIASRAIHHGGRGNEYWKHFEPGVREEIITVGQETYELLFEPRAVEHIKTFRAPVGGMTHAAQALPMIFYFVNFCNRTAVSPDLEDDTTGKSTVIFLKNARRMLRRITGIHPSSLGLHPFVYFYSPTGKHQPILFHAFTEFFADMDTQRLVRFTAIRKAFEELVVENKTLVSQVIRKFGSKSSGRENLVRFFAGVNSAMHSGAQSAAEVVERLQNDSRFSFLQPAETAEEIVHSKEFSSDTKAAVIIRERFKGEVRCGVCGGFVSAGAMSLDHVHDKRFGGVGSVSNAQIVHPFCNSTAKDRLKGDVIRAGADAD